MDVLRNEMYKAATAVRSRFTKADPLVVHETFYGLGGGHTVARICDVDIRLGNLSCDSDKHFRAYYESLAPITNRPPTCPVDIMEVPLADIEDAHGILLFIRVAISSPKPLGLNTGHV